MTNFLKTFTKNAHEAQYLPSTLARGEHSFSSDMYCKQTEHDDIIFQRWRCCFHVIGSGCRELFKFLR